MLLIFPYLKILDATLVMHDQRAEVFDYFSTQLGYRVLFIESVCDDPVLLEENFREILKYSADYTGMDPEEAMNDLKLKIAHYKLAYQPMDEKNYPRIRIDISTMEIHAHKVTGHLESTVLGFLASIHLKPHTLYFSRVSNKSPE